MRIDPCRTFISAMVVLFCLSFGLPRIAHAQTPTQKLSVHWEELTASDFREGVRRSQGVCLLP
ncbi:MAG TPA: hypothetical protein VMU05_25435, partial [Dongiaceae bacterium]|nr:hypothetical protein [Dongiaceae bacterium]